VGVHSLPLLPNPKRKQKGGSRYLSPEREKGLSSKGHAAVALVAGEKGKKKPAELATKGKKKKRNARRHQVQMGPAVIVLPRKKGGGGKKKGSFFCCEGGKEKKTAAIAGGGRWVSRCQLIHRGEGGGKVSYFVKGGKGGRKKKTKVAAGNETRVYLSKKGEEKRWNKEKKKKVETGFYFEGGPMHFVLERGGGRKRPRTIAILPGGEENLIAL